MSYSVGYNYFTFLSDLFLARAIKVQLFVYDLSSTHSSLSFFYNFVFALENNDFFAIGLELRMVKKLSLKVKDV